MDCECLTRLGDVGALFCQTRPVGLSSLPKVTPLHLAQVSLPAGHPAAVSTPSVPVFGFAIDHPDGTILVDTGVGHGNALIDDLYRPDRSDLGDCLRRIGVHLDRVIAVVNSHLHFDHCGQNPLLHGSDTRFLSQAVEIAAVEADPHYTVADWATAPAAQQRVVRGDEQIVAGVSILATPGHTAGHQSVVIEGGGRRVVIGAQVVWHRSELDAQVASSANVDPDPELQRAAVDSIRRLKALEPELILLSHCEAHSPRARQE
jgi:N-acyl homoserine lactone hydrolase